MKAKAARTLSKFDLIHIWGASGGSWLAGLPAKQDRENVPRLLAKATVRATASATNFSHCLTSANQPKTGKMTGEPGENINSTPPPTGLERYAKRKDVQQCCFNYSAKLMVFSRPKDKD
eukprot:1139024-Pelagomonas_calceolata.AAC.2